MIDNLSDDDCTLLDGYAIFIQLVVGLSGAVALLVKRYFERPQRQWLVWMFDTSQQVLAAGALHLTNVLASTISGKQHKELINEDACVWYLTSLIVDGTLLLFLMAMLLKLLHWFVDQKNIVALRHGEYGDPPRWSIWSLQLTVYALLLFSAKAVCLYVLYKHAGTIVDIAKYLLHPFEGCRRLKLTMVMLVAPVIITVIQYWILDQLIKADWRRGTATTWNPLRIENSDDDDLNRSNSISTTNYENQDFSKESFAQPDHFQSGLSREESYKNQNRRNDKL